MNGITNNQTTQSAETAALADAMRNLTIKQGNNSVTKNIKLDMAHVTLLAENLDISRQTAMDLLRANDADIIKAMRAWMIG